MGVAGSVPLSLKGAQKEIPQFWRSELPDFHVSHESRCQVARWFQGPFQFCLFRRAECDHVLGKAGLQAGEERAETLRESKVLLLVSFHNLCVSLGETRSSRRNEPTSPAQRNQTARQAEADTR